MKKDAILSDDRKYRYILSRTWDEIKPIVLFIGLIHQLPTKPKFQVEISHP